MSWSYERRIARALNLTGGFPESGALLAFYQRVAQFQRAIFDQFNTSGETDIGSLLTYYPALLQVVNRYGPPVLAAHAKEHLSTAIAQEAGLRDLWRGERLEAEPAKFFARALVQPFAEYLASRAKTDTDTTGSSCPFCNARPVAAILRGEGEGAKRSLLCSLCATEWQYRRVVCPNCGESDKDQLPIYLATDLEHIRVDACDTCKTYLKSVDLTKDGHAVPVVDEMAALSLALWAEDSGYVKLETNLVGM